MVFHV
jgi:hypothetical protein